MLSISTLANDLFPPNPIGVWVADVFGHGMVLAIRPDGSCELGDQPGRWHRDGSKLTLTVGGESTDARFDGQRITQASDDFALVFRRRV